MLRNHPFSRQIAARYCKGQTGVSFGAIVRRAVIVWRRPAKPLKRQAAVKPVVTVMAGVVMTPVVHKHFVAGPKFGSPQTKIFQSLHHRDGPLHVHSTAQSRSSLTKVFMQNAPLPNAVLVRDDRPATVLNKAALLMRAPAVGQTAPQSRAMSLGAMAPLARHEWPQIQHNHRLRPVVMARLVGGQLAASTGRSPTQLWVQSRAEARPTRGVAPVEEVFAQVNRDLGTPRATGVHGAETTLLLWRRSVPVSVKATATTLAEPMRASSRLGLSQSATPDSVIAIEPGAPGAAAVQTGRVSPGTDWTDPVRLGQLTDEVWRRLEKKSRILRERHGT